MTNLVLALGMALSGMAQAKETKISVDSLRYSASASAHFELLQNDLVREAIETCGGQDHVESLSSLNIQIEAGIGDAGVATIDRNNSRELNLTYPRVVASAQVICK